MSDNNEKDSIKDQDEGFHLLSQTESLQTADSVNQNLFQTKNDGVETGSGARRSSIVKNFWSSSSISTENLDLEPTVSAKEQNVEETNVSKSDQGQDLDSEKVGQDIEKSETISSETDLKLNEPVSVCLGPTVSAKKQNVETDVSKSDQDLDSEKVGQDIQIQSETISSEFDLKLNEPFSECDESCPGENVQKSSSDQEKAPTLNERTDTQTNSLEIEPILPPNDIVAEGGAGASEKDANLDVKVPEPLESRREESGLAEQPSSTSEMPKEPEISCLASDIVSPVTESAAVSIESSDSSPSNALNVDVQHIAASEDNSTTVLSSSSIPPEVDEQIEENMVLSSETVDKAAAEGNQSCQGNKDGDICQENRDHPNVATDSEDTVYQAVSAIELMTNEDQASGEHSNKDSQDDRCSSDSPDLQIVEDPQPHPFFANVTTASMVGGQLLAAPDQYAQKFRTLLPKPVAPSQPSPQSNHKDYPMKLAPKFPGMAAGVVRTRTIIPSSTISPTNPQQIFEEQLQSSAIRRRKRQLYNNYLGTANAQVSELSQPLQATGAVSGKTGAVFGQVANVVYSGNGDRPRISAVVSHVPIVTRVEPNIANRTAVDSNSLQRNHEATNFVSSSPQPLVLAQQVGLTNSMGSPKREDPMLKVLLSRPPSPAPYKFQPPPPELGLNIPEGGYPCMDCGDIYALKTSLAFHLERRVMVIQAQCGMCRTSFVFYNRCKFLEHQRKHVEDAQKASMATKIKAVYRDVQVSALQGSGLEQAYDTWMNSAPFQTMSDLVTLYEAEFGPVSPALKKLMESSDDIEVVPVNPVGSLQPEPPQLRRMGDVASRAPIEGSALPPGATKCTECDHIQPTITSLKRHFVFNLPPNQKQFICQSCSAVYFSLCSFSAHKRSHQKLPEKQTPFTCPECGLLQASSKSLSTHLLNHKSAPTIINAWRCQKCFTFYSNWHTLVVHIATNHSEYYFKCPRCPTAYQGFTNYDEHRRVHSGPGQDLIPAEMVPKCPNCEAIMKNREQMIEHLKGHLHDMEPLKVYRCPICGRLMENKNGLIAHYSRTHMIIMKPHDVVDKAFEIDEPAGPNSAPNFVRIAPKQQQVPQQPRMQGVYPQGGALVQQLHMKVKHGEDTGPQGSVATATPVYGQPHNQGAMGYGGQPSVTYGQQAQRGQQTQASPNSSLVMKGGYACKKFGCFFVAGTRDEMRGHAANTHRDSSHFLCLECGLSFVAEEALKRHLMAHHQIADPSSYVRQYAGCLPMINTPMGHKCTVCGNMFGTEIELQIHSRKHGMLFLQHQRTGQGGVSKY